MSNQLDLFKKSPRNSKLHLTEIKKIKNNDLNCILNHPDIYFISEYIENKLFFAVLNEGKYEPQKYSDVDFFSIDNELIYINFYDDFGPLNLGCLYKYCWKVNKKLNHPSNRRRQIVHYTIKDDEKRANAAYLITSYAVLYLNKNPKDAYKPLVQGNLSLKPFRDATIGVSSYNIRLQDCLNALLKAATFRFFDFEDFNLSEYEKYEKLENGDLNWIVPQKFLAFIGPSAESNRYHPPEHYFDYFLKNNVVAVVRLNREPYDASKFQKLGIHHHDMLMPDGSVPPRDILNHFLHLSENADGAIAVHCRAGLGRTGSLICAYLIKHYKMTAREAIAWARICRPGSVIGHQQAWLENMQKELWHAGQQYRLKQYGDINFIVRHKRGIYSIIQKLDNRSYGGYLKHKIIEEENDDDKEENATSSESAKKLKISEDEISTLHEEETSSIYKKNLTKYKKQLLKKKEPTNLIDFTQGDRLNKIKMKRSEAMKKMIEKYNFV